MRFAHTAGSGQLLLLRIIQPDYIVRTTMSVNGKKEKKRIPSLVYHDSLSASQTRMAAYSLNSMRAGMPAQNGSSAFRDNKNFYRLYLSRDNIIGGRFRLRAK
ncbi:hypothetical protein DTG00_13650 [Salmonella enterica subsp. enterica]|nr:hypothetical protein [Salmonella enterica subsp. enterica]MJY56588.1 hypothetical protein [Salmonella enterica subsp. enterica serovar Milwaukee]